MVRRWALGVGLAVLVLGAVALYASSARAETATVQPSYQGDCQRLPTGSICLTFEDGYTWLVQDTISGWGRNHGPIQIFFGAEADYGHELGTDRVWMLPKP